MKKTLIFIRHAHRDTSDKSRDNGIDDKGREQIKELLKKYSSGKLPESKEFWSSPKLRCKETIEPLADHAGVKIKIVPELDEQNDHESGREFKLRVFNFLHKLKREDKVIYICSHGDWLPEALQELTGHWVDVKKSQALVCENNGKGWKIVE